MTELPYEHNKGQTHWDGCWASRGHHNCAVCEINRLRAELEAAKKDTARHLFLLRQVMGHSEDVQPGMVLEYLGYDIRAAIDDAKGGER